MIIIVILIVSLQIKNYLQNSWDQNFWSWDVFSWGSAKDLIVWQKIIFAGNMDIDNHFPVYTHSIYRWGTQIGLRSSSINLNNYTGEIEVAGLVLEIYKWIPIIDVSVVKLEKPGLIVKWNTYTFIKDLIYFDFSDQVQLSANKSWKNISIYFEKEPVFSLERFLCSKIITDKDCNQIIETYITAKKEFFNSSLGYVYYKISDSQWALFDWNLFGYIFRNTDDNTLLDMSSMIKIINKNFVLANKYELIKEKCKNDEYKVKDISFSKLWFNDPYYVVMTVEGSTKSKKDYSCSITFDLWNERAVKDVDFRITD